eukprot:tig00021612_g22872.t1
MRCGVVVLLLAALAACTVAVEHRRTHGSNDLANHAAHPRKVLLLGEVIDTTRAESEADAGPEATSSRGLRAVRHRAASTKAQRIYIVQLESPVTAAAQRAVEAAGGVRLGPYIPHNAYLVSATAEQLARIRAVPHVVWAGRLKREHKAHPMLAGPAARAYSTWTAHVAAEWAAGQGVPTAHRLAGVWRRQLSASLRGNFSIEALDEGRVRVTLRNPHDGPLALEFLSNQGLVHWVEPRRPIVLKNLYASRVIQADVTSTAEQLADLVANQRAIATPIYDRGIAGAGEVVGVMDDGLDYDHCYFAESSGVSPIPDPLVSDSKAQPQRRKVIASRFNTQYGNPMISKAHGTHTAATAVGNPCSGCVPSAATPGATQASTLAHRGIAYDAQLSFISMADRSGNLLTYEWDKAFVVHYNDGVRVHSNSWGCAPAAERPFECNVYDEDAVRVDSYAWYFPDALLIFAGGNDGATPRPANSGKGVISTPATAKNGISVGSVLSTTAGFLAGTETVAGSTPVDNRPGMKACAAYPNWCNREAVRAATDVVSSNNLATFSSYGPTFDGRVKPEVVATGFFVISANADSASDSFNCGLRAEIGTSMSAPVVAGAAALVRQYFREGWWPSGTKRAADAIPAPQASLLRAAMVNGARPVTGTVASDLAHPGSTCTAAVGCKRTSVGPPSEPAPNAFQGYGRVRLDTVLYFSDSPFQMAFCDGYFAPGDNTPVRVNMTVTGTLRATLAWTDPPGKANAQVPLVNNIDLTLTAPNSTAFTFVHPNGGDLPDNVNNVEHIEYSPPGGGPTVVVLTVAPTRIDPLWGPQPWSLVLHGRWLGSIPGGCTRSVSIPVPADGPSNPHVTDEIPAVPELTSGFVLMANVTVALPIAEWSEAYAGHFARALGRQIGVSGNRVVVDGVHNGSTVVSMYLRPVEYGNAALEASSAQAYRNLARINTNLALGPGLAVLALSQFRVMRPRTPAGASPDPGGKAVLPPSPSPTPAPAADESTKVIAGVVAGASALVVILAGIALLLMRRAIREKRAIITRMEEAQRQVQVVRVDLDADHPQPLFLAPGRDPLGASAREGPSLAATSDPGTHILPIPALPPLVHEPLPPRSASLGGALPRAPSVRAPPREPPRSGGSLSPEDVPVVLLPRPSALAAPAAAAGRDDDSDDETTSGGPLSSAAVRSAAPGRPNVFDADAHAVHLDVPRVAPGGPLPAATIKATDVFL